jgi:hypothetical protein
VEILKKTPLLVEVICLHVRINKLVKGKIVSYDSYKPKTNKKKKKMWQLNKYSEISFELSKVLACN